MIVAWLAIWPLWLALLCVPLILMSPGCGCCGPAPICDCASGTCPDTWTIVLAGISNLDCSSCGDYNDTYETGSVQEDAEGCYWDYEFPSSPCAVSGPADRLRVRRGTDDSGNWWFHVTLTIGDVLTNRWTTGFLAYDDCDLSGYVCDWAEKDPPFGGACAFTSFGANSTATITANGPFT